METNHTEAQLQALAACVEAFAFLSGKGVASTSLTHYLLGDISTSLQAESTTSFGCLYSHSLVAVVACLLDSS